MLDIFSVDPFFFFFALPQCYLMFTLLMVMWETLVFLRPFCRTPLTILPNSGQEALAICARW